MLKNCPIFDNPLILASVTQFDQNSASLATASYCAFRKCFICAVSMSRSRDIQYFYYKKLLIRNSTLRSPKNEGTPVLGK